MKTSGFFFLTLFFSGTLIYAEKITMKVQDLDFEVLRQMEQCYETICPARENSEETFAWFSGLSHPLFNAVMHLSCRPEQIASKVDELIASAPSTVPISFWVHPKNNAPGLAETLKQKGFQPAVSCPLMSWKVTQPKVVAKADIRPANMEIFHDITATVNQFDDKFKQEFIAIMRAFKSENYLIYADDHPVGTGVLLSMGTVGGIFNLATLPEHQKKGHGRAMMLFLMNRAHELGLQRLVLLSSPAAEKLYTDLAFRKAFDVVLYVK